MRRLQFLVLCVAACSKSSSTTPLAAIPATATLTAPASALANPVDVVRDQWGIPHIYGQSIPDVAYAQGYFMAQDRWVELDLLRHAADGTLSSVFGPVELSADIGMRMQHLRTTAQTGLAALKAATDPQAQTIVASLNAFAAGVNAWQADLQAGKYSLPVQLVDLYTPASVTPWLPEDSVLLGEFLAWQLAFDDEADLIRTDLDLAVAQTFRSGNPRANLNADLENTSPPDPSVVIAGGWGFDTDNSTARLEPGFTPQKLHDRKRSKAMHKLRQLFDADAKALAAVGYRSPLQLAHGSNNWAIAPKNSATGHVLIANDTHLPLQNPPIFYMSHLVARSGGTTLLNVMGEQFPGVPFITLGMNQHNAWAATVSFIDATDLYQIPISSCGSNFCTTFNGQSVTLQADVEEFDIGSLGKIQPNGASVTYYIDPNHGPLLPRVNADHTLQPLNVGGSEIAVKYTGYTSAPLIRAIFGLDTAGSMQEAVAALDPNFRYGGQNWVIGDDQGNIGWTQTCEAPLRNVPSGQTTIVPFKVMPGDGTAEWLGSLDPHLIPHAYNPAQGYISTANNDPIGTTLLNDAYYGQPLADAGNAHLYLGVDYDPGTREGRIESRINNVIGDGGKFTLEDMSSIQADAISEYGQMLAPTFMDAVSALATAMNAGPGDGGPLDVSAYALDAGSVVQGLFPTIQGWVQGWSFDMPSGISDADAGAPTSQEVSDSQAALVMAAFSHYFVHQTFDDELAALGTDAGAFPASDLMISNAAIRLAVHPEKTQAQISPVTGDPIEFDDLSTPKIVESKRQIAARAVIASMNYLVSQLGPTAANWRWGQLHTLTLDFVGTSAIGLNIPNGQVFPNGFPRHGGDGTVDVGGASVSLTNFTYDQGPAIRFTCELDPDAGPHGRNVLPGGEVFDPKSPHYRDQMELWRKNQTIDWSYQDSDVLSAAQTEYQNNQIGRTHFALP